MTRQDLSVFLQDWFCGCGNPRDAAAALLRLLRLHPAYDHTEELEALIPDNGIRHLLLYHLDQLGLTEHGGNIGGAWLTDKGEAVQDALSREEVDGFVALLQLRCVHGFSDDEPHDCAGTSTGLSWS